MFHPIKAIYVKNNPNPDPSVPLLPGEGGEGTNITYEKFTIHRPLWWAIYIGP